MGNNLFIDWSSAHYQFWNSYVGLKVKHFDLFIMTQVSSVGSAKTTLEDIFMR